jgi:raffinose/stachyose/melibiose transport system permease protein
MRSPTRHALSTLRAGLLWAVAALFSIPLYLLIVVSLKTPQQIAQSPFALPLDPQWSNFAEAWQRSAGSASATLGGSILNSAIVTTVAVVLILAISASAGYYLGRSFRKSSQYVYLGIVVALTIPIQLVIIPVYSTFDDLGVLGNLLATSLFYVGFISPLGIFLITGFVRAIPREFEEAARVDGASQLQTFRLIIVPLLQPILATVAILSAIAVWNDFFGQLVFLLGSGNETLPLTIFTFASTYASRYDLLAAGLVIATIPLAIFYLLLQRRIVEGFSSGIKG